MRRVLVTMMVLAGTSAIAAWGCGKSVFLDGEADQKTPGDLGVVPKPDDSGPGINPTPVPTAAPTEQCPSDRQYYQKFIQPDDTVNNSVDMLFVVDSSSSLDANRSKVVNELDAFTSSLQSGTDLRMAVLLGHGGGSSFSGKLFQHNGSDPAVLNSTLQSVADMRQALLNKVRSRVADLDEANGEALLYSLTKLLSNRPLVETQGFLRPDASWSIVFITDENDVCMPPELHGFSTFPDYVPSAGGGELIAYRRYCLDGAGHEVVTPGALAQTLANIHPGYPVALGGVIHHSGSPFTRNGEQAIGHGVLELLQLHHPSTLIGINDSSYRAGLGQLATQSVTRSHVTSTVPLAGGSRLVPDSVRVVVDAQGVDSSYDDAGHAIVLQQAAAGHAKSVVEVRGCRLEGPSH